MISRKTATQPDQRVSQVRKEELISTYERVVQATWDHFEAVLGKVVMREEVGVRCLTQTQESHSVAKSLQLIDGGVSFEGLRQQIHTLEHEELRGVLERLFNSLISVATEVLFDIFHTAR
jgi:hypothetical protein